MNLSDAYKELDISSKASEDEVKKKYKSLTKKYHPDVNKDPGAEAKFKKISEAYNLIQKGDVQPSWNAHGGFKVITIEHIELSTTISFKESVLGCKRDLNFKCNSKCQNCHGRGKRILNNGCTECGGSGMKIQNQNNMIFQSTCPKCHGKQLVEPCTPCKATGAVSLERSINVQIPPGIKPNTKLRLAGIGNYVDSGIFGEQNSDVHLTVKVTPQDNLTIDEQDVVSFLNISLMEALTGTVKTVPTINGTHEITVPKYSRNKEEVLIPGFGVNKIGNQRVILDVCYPAETDKLIKALSSISLPS